MAHTSDFETGWNAVSSTGAVAAGGAGAVAAGIEILERCGNAADAAAGTILALNVTDHGACSIGGEVPVILYDAGRNEVKTLSGQGRAPLSREAIDWYMEHGIPDRDMKMAPVPSVVDLCTTLLIRYGSQSFEAIVSPTLAILDEGEESWHPRLAVTLRRLVEAEQAARGSREEKVAAASDRFYGRNGASQDVADELEADYVEKGGFLRKADLAAHRTLIEDPVAVNYRGYDVYKCGPWTQGPYLCQALRLLEGYDLKSMGHLSADYVHVAVEALKLAMADRDAYYADPEFADVPMSELLSDAYTEIRRPLIDMGKASLEARPGDPYGMKALRGERRVRTGYRRYDDVRGRGPLGKRRFGNAECECVPGRNATWRSDGGVVRKPPAKPEYDPRSSQLHPAGETPAHHADAHACPEGRQADSGDQRRRRRPAGPGDAEPAPGFHRVRHAS